MNPSTMNLTPELFLTAVRETVREVMSEFRNKPRANYREAPREVVRDTPREYTAPSYARTSYQDMLKHTQDKISNTPISNKCMKETCVNQTTDNNLYCDVCSDNGTKCKKCNINDRNGIHPIFVQRRCK
jgi:hypothetical protein